MNNLQFLLNDQGGADNQGGRLAYQHIDGSGDQPGIVFCGGYHSDMTGTKATWLADYARDHNQSFVRFDYHGHGKSSGEWADATIGSRLRDTCRVIDELTDGPQILIGSSLGGWIALRTAQERGDRIAKLILIAPAPDFTIDQIWDGMDDNQRARLEDDGLIMAESDYGDDYPIKYHFIEESRDHLLLRKDEIELPEVPVRILHGMMDDAVPVDTSIRIIKRLSVNDATLTLIRKGDHSLSDDHGLRELGRALKI
jgi:pimeloyl-ACP methyl ester carboxylesterase